uniref:Uncharacterized protein n=1 Tax=Anopheles atroparvus TaxID=41427 RepID=A0A182J0Q0_ANOAO
MMLRRRLQNWTGLERVEQRDESHVSLESSSSSALPNQLEAADFFVPERPPPEPSLPPPVAFLLDDDDDEADDEEDEPVMKFSMAWPIMRASTMALRPSHLSLFSGDRDSDLGFGFGSSRAGSLSRSLSSVSRANVTVALGDLADDLRRAIGWWRLMNQPDSTDDFSGSDGPPLPTSEEPPVASCLMFWYSEMSKLFERFFCRLLFSGSPPDPAAPKVEVDAAAAAAAAEVGLLRTDLSGNGREARGLGSSFSPHRLISVADEARDDKRDMRSVLVHTMPIFVFGLNGASAAGVEAMALAAAAAAAAEVAAEVAAACSRGDGPDPSPPRSDSRRTWLAVMPLVHGGVGSECLRVSRQGDSKYGFSGESMSRLWRWDDWVLASSSFSLFSDSSTTISGSCPPCVNDGVWDDLRIRKNVSGKMRWKSFISFYRGRYSKEFPTVASVSALDACSKRFGSHCWMHRNC